MTVGHPPTVAAARRGRSLAQRQNPDNDYRIYDLERKLVIV